MIAPAQERCTVRMEIVVNTAVRGDISIPIHVHADAIVQAMMQGRIAIAISDVISISVLYEFTIILPCQYIYYPE